MYTWEQLRSEAPCAPHFGVVTVSRHSREFDFPVGWRLAGILGALAALCLLAYWRFLSLPFVSDDYLAIKLGREYAAPGGWSKLASDALYRCRATSIVLTYWIDGFFGLNSTAYNSCSLILHILNTWLVFTLGFWRPIGWRRRNDLGPAHTILTYQAGRALVVLAEERVADDEDI